MDNVVINITELPNNVSFQITEGGGGMQCADLAACQTIIDIESGIDDLQQQIDNLPTTTPNLQQVVTASPILNDPITSQDGNTYISISNNNLNLVTDGFLTLEGNIVNINGVQVATIDDIKTKYKETFTYNGIALTLSNTCSFMYSLNWGNLALNEGVDYSFSGTTLTILNSNINNGDLLYATYE